ncbi:MAG: hypothetical protein SchgKO_15920 [Schleiferiaceae bacterium]
MKKIAAISVLALSVMACSSNNKKTSNEPTALELSENLAKTASEDATVFTLDHHGMAAEEGVEMPQSVATLISEPHINLPLLEQFPLIGLDLPFKFLIYQESDSTGLMAAYTSGEFMARRHGFSSIDFIAEYEQEALRRVKKAGDLPMAKVKYDLVTERYGMVFIPSEKDFDATIASLKSAVMGQGDTRWFGEIEYHEEAAKTGVTLPRSTLLLFGGPAPGGKAMAQYPRLGLDAFCQKILVFENQEGRVQIVYNDIVEFAKLYYGDYTKAHEVINGRLKQTFTAALKADEIAQE